MPSFLALLLLTFCSLLVVIVYSLGLWVRLKFTCIRHKVLT